MVQIPTKTSSLRLTTQTTAPEVRDVGSFTKVGAAIEKAGQVLSGVSQEFRRLEILRESTAATLDINKALMEKESEYLNDPNLTQKSGMEYHQWAESYVNERLGQISDEDTRLRLGVQFQGTALQRGFNVKKAGRDNDIALENVATSQLEEDALEEAVAGNDEYFMFTKENMKQHYNQRIIAKTMTTAEAQEAIIKWEDNYEKRKPMFDLNRNIQTHGSAGAEVFIQEVMNHKYGWLDTKAENDLIAEAQQRMTAEKKLEDWKLEKAQEKTLDELLPSILDPESGLTDTDIDILVLRRILDPTDADRAKKVLNGKLGLGVTPNPFVVNRIYNMKLGEILKPDGTRYSGIELRREVLNNIQQIGNAKALELLNEFKQVDSNLQEECFTKDKGILFKEYI
jgi:hypothetical protein